MIARMQRAKNHSHPPGFVPDQRLIWLHSADPVRLPALGDLASRLKQLNDDVFVLASCAKSRDLRVPNAVDHLIELGGDMPSDAMQSLEAWQPQVGVWAGPELLPKLQRRLAANGTRLLWCDVEMDHVPMRKRRWLPAFSTANISAFHAIFAANDMAATALSKLALTSTNVRTVAPLQRAATPPTCSDDDLTEMKTAIGGRPVWLAALVGRDEIDLVLQAHRAVLRLQHRSMLIIVPADMADATYIRSQLDTLSLRYADWDSGTLPADLTQVILSEDPYDLGLWYRVAALSFMGGTIHPHRDTPHPMHAAGLGAGVVVGPQVEDHQDVIETLIRAGAAARIKEGKALGDVVLDRIAPHRAAEMALAGWEVATNGAELIDLLADHITEYLDELRRSDARA